MDARSLTSRAALTSTLAQHLTGDGVSPDVELLRELYGEKLLQSEDVARAERAAFREEIRSEDSHVHQHVGLEQREVFRSVPHVALVKRVVGYEDHRAGLGEGYSRTSAGAGGDHH